MRRHVEPSVWSTTVPAGPTNQHTDRDGEAPATSVTPAPVCWICQVAPPSSDRWTAPSRMIRHRLVLSAEAISDTATSSRVARANANDSAAGFCALIRRPASFFAASSDVVRLPAGGAGAGAAMGGVGEAAATEAAGDVAASVARCSADFAAGGGAGAFGASAFFFSRGAADRVLAADGWSAPRGEPRSASCRVEFESGLATGAVLATGAGATCSCDLVLCQPNWTPHTRSAAAAANGATHFSADARHQGDFA